jgi:hypothetical protein
MAGYRALVDLFRSRAGAKRGGTPADDPDFS